MLNRTLSNLTSRVIRGNALSGRRGRELLESGGQHLTRVRRIVNRGPLREQDEQGNFITRFFDDTVRFFNWIDQFIHWSSWSIEGVTNWVRGAIENVKAFNWNATDKELKEGLKQRNIQLAAIWGGVFGQGFGWLVALAVGYGIGYVVPVIGGGPLARLIAVKVAEEGFDEVISSLTHAVWETTEVIGDNVVANLYMNYRSFFKRLDKETLTILYGERAAHYIKTVWGEEGSPELSFNQYMDDNIEGIRNPYLKGFAEEFLEESWDGFMDGVIIIARSLDEAYAANRAADQNELGTERDLVLLPDAQAPDETIVIADMPQTDAMTTVQQALINHRLLYGRDVGIVMGPDAEEFVRGHYVKRRLRLEWHEREAPPWRLLDGSRGVKPYTHIPNPKTNLKWNEIKTAAKKYTWGPWLCTQVYDSGRKTQVWAASEGIGYQLLDRLVTLSEDKPIRRYATKQDVSNPLERKASTLVYPKHGALIQPQSPFARGDSHERDRKSFQNKSQRFALWTDFEPDDYPSFSITTNLNN